MGFIHTSVVTGCLTLSISDGNPLLAEIVYRRRERINGDRDHGASFVLLHNPRSVRHRLKFAVTLYYPERSHIEQLESANVFDTEGEAMDRLAHLQQTTGDPNLVVVLCEWRASQWGKPNGKWTIKRILRESDQAE